MQFSDLTYTLSSDCKKATIGFKINDARYIDTLQEKIYSLISAKINFIGYYYDDKGSELEKYQTEKGEPKHLQSNKLIQTESTFGTKKLSDWILSTIKGKYENEIKCFDLECLAVEYKDIDGTIAIAKGQLFKRYDLIVPYVIRKGRKTPYSYDEKGIPSAYCIVGIEYSYSGILKQKLYLQETLN
jgi:hypothetical protein